MADATLNPTIHSPPLSRVSDSGWSGSKIHLKEKCTQTPWGRMFSRENEGPVRHPDCVVILVPGMIVSGSYMVPLARELVSDCRIYIIDFPGYGRSEKPSEVLNISGLADALAAWMNGNAIPRANLIANSFGCQIVADFASRYPDMVSRVVLQGPTVDPTARNVLIQAVRLKINSWRESRSVGTISVKDYKSAGAKRVLKTIRLTLKDRIETKLPNIQAPVLVVRGDRDPVVPQWWAEEVTKMVPQARLAIIPGGAHTLNYSEPEKFAKVLREFLNLNDDRQVAE